MTGNIFLSNLQTITVTVNCKGVMGKGTALVAKHMFPSMFQFYKNTCRDGAMRLGSPLLFDKKNKDTIIDDDNYKKILLFPTKNHWKDQSDLTQIEKGLLWLVENYEKLGVTSLAIPALGCGNGGLEWKDVGPIMCRYLDKMKILTHVYLPEKVVSPQYLSNEYLLGAKNKITDF